MASCRRILGPLAVLCLVIGCQGAPVNSGPFGTYGPTTVPPPPTGSAGRPDPYYRRSMAGDNRLSQADAGYPTNDLGRFSSRESSAAISTADRRAGVNDGASYQPTDRYDRGMGPTDQLEWREPEMAQDVMPTSGSGTRARPRFYRQGAGLSYVDEPLALDPQIERVAGQIPMRDDESGWSAVDRTRR